MNRRKFLYSLSAFGLLPSYPSFSIESNPEVVVIGAGAAGLAATDRLIKKGISAICLEANNRIGGRAHTNTEYFGIPYDVGAHWIHNAKSSPYLDYGLSAEAEGFDVYKPPTSGGEQKYKVYDGKRDITDTSLERGLWKEYNKVSNLISAAALKGLDVSASSVVGKSQSEWFETVHQLIGPYDMAKDFKDTSCVDFNTYPSWSLDWFCKQGYGALVKHRWRGLPVHLNTIVKEIHYTAQDKVEIETSKGKLNPRKCIVTVSNGILASENIKFFPKLSEDKVEAFNKVKMGTYNHVAGLFKEEFFREIGMEEMDMYLYYKISGSNISPRGMGCLMNISDSNLCYFDYGGDFAKELENEGEAAQKSFTIGQLKSIFGSKIDKYLLKLHATQWGKNKFTLGSYASADPGFAHLRKYLKIPVEDKIFFAGEATAFEYASVSGAHRSGIRAADEVIKALNF
tara:strand:+ start:11 stop:1378 length:1368 start_codon:yes stop_codon:yes gene_type:complete